MQHRILFGIFVAAATLCVAVAGGNYLAEKPTFLNTCARTDPHFNQCFADNFRSIFREWKNGVPGLSSLGPLDPLHIKRMSVVQDKSNSLIQLNASLLNIKLHGVSDVVMGDSTFDWNKLVSTFKIFVPKVHINGDFLAKGIIFNLPLDSKGKVDMTIENSELFMATRYKLRDEYGFTFMDMDKFRLGITNVGGFQIHVDNLFNGQKELEDSTNKLLNQSWREFFDVLSPAITEGMRTIMSNWLTKLLAYVPANYMIEDIP